MRRALLLAILALGCTDGAAEPDCRLNSDCPADMTCMAGACVPECREDRDCRAPETCMEGRCIDPGPQDRLCLRASDCLAGESCLNGLCSPISLGVRDGGVRDAGAGVTPDGGVAGLAYGAVCSSGTQCASTYCIGESGAPTGRCTIPCAQDGECVYPDTCEAIPGVGMFCASVAAGKPTGAECQAAGECAGGTCIVRPSAAGFCSEPCGPLPSCPPMFTCQPLPDGAGSAQTLCVPGTGGGFGANCNGPADCFTTLCVGVPGSTGVCTSLCDRVPCPTGYTCLAVDDGAGGQLQVCAPDGAVGGGYGDACTGASSCQTGLCLHDARTGGAFCTQACNTNADCSAVPGLVCVRLADGSRVCGPP